MDEEIEGEKDIRAEIEKDPLSIISKQINLLGSLISQIEDVSIKREFSKLTFYVGIVIGLYIKEKHAVKSIRSKGGV